MGSMDNLKSEKQINNWISKYPENYVIMSKLDGISGLLYKNGHITCILVLDQYPIYILWCALYILIGLRDH